MGLSIFISIFFFPQIFFLINSQLRKTILKISEFLDNELKAVFGEISLSGTIFIFLSIIFQYNNLLAHLVPTGTPAFLIPIMVIIETVRNIIRPITLSIRLAANIVAGHLLLTLLGSQGPRLRSINLIFLIIGLYLLLLLEVAVACIQSYVFTILSSLYLNELIRNSFNKIFL